MARIAGVDIPDKKRGEIALTYIYGIGRSRAKKILTDAGISVDKKASEWSDDEASAVRNAISNEYKVEGQLALRSAVEHQTFNGHWLLPWVCVTGKACPFVVSIRKTTPVPGKESGRQLLTRRK